MTFANVPGNPPPPPPYAPPPPAGGGGGSDNRTMMVVLSYLGLLALIPLLTEKSDPDIQWHAKHGLVLAAAQVVVIVVLAVVYGVLSIITGGLACILGPIFGLLFLATLIPFVLCIAKALKGERFLIPGLSDFANRF